MRVGSLELANALAACALSARLNSGHRQWAAQQLVQALAASERDSSIRPQSYSDTAGDLRQCPLSKLEAHHNRVAYLQNNTLREGVTGKIINNRVVKLSYCHHHEVDYFPYRVFLFFLHGSL